jgi:hypothetical protein
MTLLIIDFMGPSAKFDKENLYIFNVVNYFFQYSWTYALPTNTKKDILGTLGKLLDWFTIPISIYADEGTHFNNSLPKAA